ncbi:MAG: DNA polymerase III subunit beta, partial [Clostridia bacterium]|nr:DNA polymerase III subunit beta [Clostridia bacterium]
MKFRCESKKLMEAVQTVIRVMAVRTPMEILEGILLDADEQGLYVTASDGNMTTVCFVPAEIETDGSVVLPGRLLSEVIRKLPADELSASLNNRFVLSLRCGGSKFNIAGKNAEEFPIPEDKGYTYSIHLPEPLLKEMVHMVSFAVPMEDQRVVLTGAFMNLENGNIDMVGLDGYRMAVKHAIISDTDTKAKAIIPCKALDEIEKLMSDDEEKMALISFSQNRLKLESGTTRFYTSLIEGEYIDYRRVIPKAFNLMATVETDDFADCIERAALIARSSRNNLIKLEIGN